MNDNASFLVLFLAPVKEYLADDQVSEILINGPSQIYVERNGRLEETGASFAGEAQLKAAAVNIAKSVDRQLDEMHPDLDARLPDGSRVTPTFRRSAGTGRSSPSANSRRRCSRWRSLRSSAAFHRRAFCC